jgi:hypothetical protein
MSMTTLTRKLGKLEAAAVCVACDALTEYFAALAELWRRHGLPPEDTTGPRIEYNPRCAWCGRRESHTFSATGEDADFFRTMIDALKTGRICAPEIRALRKKFEAEVFAGCVWLSEAETLIEKYRAKQASAGAQRFPYVCTVAGCRCENPKGTVQSEAFR